MRFACTFSVPSDMVSCYLFWLRDSGYTGVYANGDGDKGVAECPFEFYHLWVTNPLAAQKMAESVTRRTIGVKCCPVVSYGCMTLLSCFLLVMSHVCVILLGWYSSSVRGARRRR